MPFNPYYTAPVGRLVRVTAALALLAWSPALAASQGAVVAQLGATRFMASDLEDFLRTMAPETRQQALANPQLMNRLIQLQLVSKALLNQALAQNWQQKPDVAKQVSTARDSIVLKSYLASVAAAPGGYPSDQEIKAAYDLNRDKFMLPRQYRLEQIFIASPPTDNKPGDALKKIKDLAAKAHAPGARFEDLARQNSQHKPSADKGGDTGWLAESQLLPEISAKVAGLSRGDISDPIKSSQGWHIVRLMDTKAASPRPLAEVKPVIAASLRQTRQQQEEQQYIVRMLQKTPVTMNQQQLQAALQAAR